MGPITSAISKGNQIQGFTNLDIINVDLIPFFTQGSKLLKKKRIKRCPVGKTRTV